MVCCQNTIIFDGNPGGPRKICVFHCTLLTTVPVLERSANYARLGFGNSIVSLVVEINCLKMSV